MPDNIPSDRPLFTTLDQADLEYEAPSIDQLDELCARLGVAPEEGSGLFLRGKSGKRYSFVELVASFVGYLDQRLAEHEQPDERPDEGGKDDPAREG